MHELQEALGRLRGLPAETEEPIAARYTVVSRSPLAVRLAPSVSAAAVAHLERGAMVEAVATRGLWVRVAPDCEGPRWMLTWHPEAGTYLSAR